MLNNNFKQLLTNVLWTDTSDSYIYSQALKQWGFRTMNKDKEYRISRNLSGQLSTRTGHSETPLSEISYMPTYKGVLPHQAGHLHWGFYWDIIIGADGTPATLEDYTMPQLFDEKKVEKLETGNFIDVNGNKLIVRTYYRNKTLEPITVKEIGLVKACTTNTNYVPSLSTILTAANEDYSAVLFGREVLPEPVVLQPNQVGEFTFEITNLLIGVQDGQTPA